MDTPRMPQPDALRRLHGLTYEQTGTALLLVVLLAAACLSPLQNDTWWHLRAGEEMWTRAFVMMTDEFSFTVRGAYWPNHEWLSEVIFYVSYRVGGLPLLTTVAAACLTAAIVMSWRLMRGSLLMRLMLTGLGIPSLAFVWAVRPHVFSQLLLMVTVGACLRRRFWVLPPMFAVWANLHGAVALGFVVLGAVALTDWYLTGIRRALKHLPVIAVCFAATMIAPLGFDLWPTIPESIHKSVSNGIAEWKPPLLGLRDVGFWLLVGVFSFRLARTWRSITSYEDALLAASAILLLPLALRHGRNMAPFALLALPAISRTLRTSPILHERRIGVRPLLNASLVGACAVAALITVVVRWAEPAARLQWNPVSPHVVGAIRACPGQLYNRFDDGGYVIWFARVPVYADSRQDPYPLEFLQEHLRHEVSGDYAPVFEKYNLGCAFLPPTSPTAARLLQDGWQVAAADSRWLVLYPAAPALPSP